MASVSEEETTVYQHLASYPAARLYFPHAPLAGDRSGHVTCDPSDNAFSSGLEDKGCFLGLHQRLVVLRCFSRRSGEAAQNGSTA